MAWIRIFFDFCLQFCLQLSVLSLQPAEFQLGAHLVFRVDSRVRREPAGNFLRVSQFSTEQHEGDVSASQTYPNAGVLALIPLPQKARGLL